MSSKIPTPPQKGKNSSVQQSNNARFGVSNLQQSKFKISVWKTTRNADWNEVNLLVDIAQKVGVFVP